MINFEDFYQFQFQINFLRGFGQGSGWEEGGGGGYKTGPRQNNLDPDKAGNLCGIPHIARIYDEKIMETRTMTSKDMWGGVCRPASQMLGASHSRAEQSCPSARSSK